MDKILVVDDTNAVLEALSLLLELHNYEVLTANTPKSALELVNKHDVSLVIQDMNFTGDTTSGEEGIALFHALRALVADMPIILITAWTDLAQAIELVKAGAADYIAKPWDDQKLITTVGNLLELGKTKREAARLRRASKEHETSRLAANKIGLVYNSASMQKLVDMALQVAKSDVSVFISGPNGSGKEKVAELIQSNSAFANKPFVRVNCGALPSDLIEAELFGAESGAYTGATKRRIGRFEAADGGTLFLDEIGNLSYEGQTKLLRVLQTGEFERLGSVDTIRVNVRLISATNADLQEMINDGSFREDLYYRLNVIELKITPLAQRPDDIAPLIAHFLPDRLVSKDAMNKLESYEWPGNIRELENACKRVSVLYPDGLLEFDDFNLAMPGDKSRSSSQIRSNEPSKDELMKAMKDFEGVIAKVARHFNLSRQALYRRLNKFEIDY
uniref:sigma-54-dependent transcriptional regulator n=1 Tax=Ningiella ruwaisensis TaxID=2364274 RepID=UPI00109F8C05|nr:sigma-54 dependent transcriptional regulator [Ningiella ruwaisensis]